MVGRTTSVVEAISECQCGCTAKLYKLAGIPDCYYYWDLVPVSRFKKVTLEFGDGKLS